MSAEKDNPFARWSRLKQAARSADNREEEKRATEAEHQEDVQPDDLQLPPSKAADGPDATEPPEPLPRLEDLTPESDLSAFLRKDVPATLRNTALRKMWSLDPAIRDYVGPAEYAWDFNKPGSMRGFGALEPGKALADFLSKVGDPGAREQNTSAEPQPVPQPEAVVSADEDSTASTTDAAISPDRIADASEPTELARPLDQPETGQAGPSLSRTADATAAPTDKNAPAESPRKSALSRHGGALPR